MKCILATTTCLLLIGMFTFTSCGERKKQFSQDIASRLPEQVDFNYHVKPILSDQCFACHGPDEAEIKGLKVGCRRTRFS